MLSSCQHGISSCQHGKPEQGFPMPCWKSLQFHRRTKVDVNNPKELLEENYVKNFQYTRPPNTATSRIMMTIKINLFVITLKKKNNNKIPVVWKRFQISYLLGQESDLPSTKTVLLIQIPRPPTSSEFVTAFRRTCGVLWLERGVKEWQWQSLFMTNTKQDMTKKILWS